MRLDNRPRPFQFLNIWTPNQVILKKKKTQEYLNSIRKIGLIGSTKSDNI